MWDKTLYQMSRKGVQEYVGISSISPSHINLQKQRGPGQSDAPSIWPDSTLPHTAAEAAAADCDL